MITNILILIILVALSAIFSGMEIALFSISDAKVSALVENKVKNAKVLQEIKAKKEMLLSSILIGNNVVNIGASAFATVFATELFGSSGAGIAVGVMTFLILIFGEITPKAIASAKNQEISLLSAKPMRLFMKTIYPIAILLEWVTQLILKFSKAPKESFVSEEEIKAVISEGLKSGEIDEDEQELLENVFEFDDLTANDAMTVYKDIFSIDGNKSVGEILKKIVKTPYSRIPVYENEKSNITGILRLREVLKYIAESFEDGKFDTSILIKELSSKPFFVPENKAIDELMEEFKKRHKHIAIVVDEYGHTVGIITMEDILEQLVGQIADETDVADNIIKRIDKNNIIVDGNEEIDEVNDFFNIDIKGPKMNSIAWLLLQEFEKIPEKDEVLEIEGIKFTVLQVSDRAIEKVKITKQNI